MIQWNELSYEAQLKTMSLIEELLMKQTDFDLQDSLGAALMELEAWSNSPIFERIIIAPGVEEVYVAQAADIEENDSHY